MSTLTPHQSQALLDAQQRASSLARKLRRESDDLLRTRDFDDDVITHREYPMRLRRGIARGASRLAIAADALDAAEAGLGAVRSASSPHPFVRPAVVEGGTPQRRTKVICVKVPDIWHVLQSFGPRIEDASHHRSTVQSIQREVEAAGPHKSLAVPLSALATAVDSLADFERYLTELQAHAKQMARAIIASQDPDGKHVAFPPVKIRPRKPRPTSAFLPGRVSGGVKGMPPGPWPGNNAGKQAIACWLARSASQAGLPPTLPVVCALVESGLSNVDHGDRDSIGLFQIRVGIHPVPPGFGSMSGKRAPASWWNAHPEAQMAWFAREAKSHRPAGAGDTPHGVAAWAVATERPAAQYAGRYGERYAEAARLVQACAKGAPSTRPTRPLTVKHPASLNASALAIALGELGRGVKETNHSNWGPKVSVYLKNAGINGPAPWCAAFVKWCFQRAGFTWPPGNWAWVPNFNAEAAKPHGLFYGVSHASAKPGDLITFGGDHIAIVKSCENGRITYVGGNQSDAVTTVSISTAASGYAILRPRAQ